MRYVVYLCVFLVTLHSTLALYTNSSFLEQRFTAFGVGVAYVASALATVVALRFASTLMTRLGATRLTVFASVAEVGALVGITLLQNTVAVVACFVAIQVLTAILYYTLDVFLEAHSRDSSTGGVRGTYLTVINAAFLFGPLLGTRIIDGYGFAHVYLAGAAIASVLAVAVGIAFARFEDPRYETPNFAAALRTYRTKPDIALVTLAFLSLWCFYVIAIIYAPLYLTETLGLSTTELGYVLALILVPFVLIQIPLGRLADSSFGEKEFMASGLFLIFVTCALVPFAASIGVMQVIAAIFIGRIGAAAVEVTCDSYFFKHVDASDAGTIATYRSMMYTAYAIVPPMMIPVISTFGFAAAFPMAACFACAGIPFALALRDTK